MSGKGNISEDEIDLVELVKVVWDKRLFIFKLNSAFFALGLIIAFTSKVEYEASCKLMPESQESGTPDLGGLGGLAGLAGINLNQAGSGLLTPELYPEIVKSTPFEVKLYNKPIYFEKIDTTLSSHNYFAEFEKPTPLSYISKYTIGLPGQIKKMFIRKPTEVLNLDRSGLVRYSEEDWRKLEGYAGRLSISVDEKTGIIKITSRMPDAVAAAIITSELVSELTTIITEYKTEKAKSSLSFVEERCLEAKKAYETKQRELANFTDGNRNVSNSVAQIEADRIQHELAIVFEVYKGLATQLEQAKIKVKEQTPVFAVLEPVRVPEKKAQPKRLFILIVSSALGFLLSLAVIYLLSLRSKFREAFTRKEAV